MTAPIFSSEFFRRQDESADERFYDFPRFVNHIDDAAIAAVTPDRKRGAEFERRAAFAFRRRGIRRRGNLRFGAVSDSPNRNFPRNRPRIKSECAARRDVFQSLFSHQSRFILERARR